jgi:hypothetical protein
MKKCIFCFQIQETSSSAPGRKTEVDRKQKKGKEKCELQTKFAVR